MTAAAESADRITAAAITGHHPFDVLGFHALLRSMRDIEFYPQHMEDFVSSDPAVRHSYQVLLFYNFHQATPGQEQDWWDKGTKEALEELGETRQGIILLHHAILAYPDWPLWAQICGIPDRRFTYHPDQTIRTEIADPHHPITRGLTPWEMVDETYLLESPGPDSHPLLVTDHPKSIKVLAWTRQYKNAPVFCYQSGHDNRVFSNPNFRTVLSRAVRWLPQS